ncbi:hypothetical protein OC861_004010 [Tilletia horrida]|nr:hypothetical protein OC861_004010 [Tilletia horrida]
MSTPTNSGPGQGRSVSTGRMAAGSGPQSPARPSEATNIDNPSRDQPQSPSGDQAHAYSSLSTTPTQSQVLQAPSPRSPKVSGVPPSASFQQPQPLSASALARNPATSSTQRAVSYAPSDISGLSLSEYSSGDDDYDGTDLGGSDLRPGSRLSKSRGTAMSASANLGSAGQRDRRNAPPPSAFDRHISGYASSQPGQSSQGTAASTRAGSTSRASGRSRPQAERRHSISRLEQRDRNDRNASKSRRQSLAREDRNPGSGDEDEENGRFGPFDQEDDEVERLDRGEELVRRRMKQRQREKALKKKKEKKEAAALRNAEAAAEGLPMTGAPTTTSSVAPSSKMTFTTATVTDDEGSDLHSSHHDEDEERDTLTGLVTEQPTQQQGAQQASLQPPQQRRGSIFSDDGGHALDDEIRSPRLGAIRPGSAAGFQNQDEIRPLDEDEEADETPSPEDLSENGDVEYTLKDRQDAINIEHPFGLPIWKPALYKKSRSVTRNAETALHSIPSAAAERHLLPGNVLWTIFFGFWLSILCFIIATALRIVPFGGAKYSRVIQELGGYLFWPFGKYVEVEIHPFGGDRNSARPFSGVGDGDDARLPDADAFEEEYLAHYARLQQNANHGRDRSDARADEDGYTTTPFTPVAARWPHDHSHRIPFNSRGSNQERSDSQATFRGGAPIQSYQGFDLDADTSNDTLRRSDAARLARATHEEQQAESSSSGGSGRDGQQSSTLPAGMSPYGSRRMPSETTSLRFSETNTKYYGATAGSGRDEEDPFLDRPAANSTAPRAEEISSLYGYELNEDGQDVGRSKRMLGTIVYGFAFWLLLAPIMGVVCLLCWGMVVSVPMGKLTWVLLKNLAKRPLALHFRSAPKPPSAVPENAIAEEDEEETTVAEGGHDTTSSSASSSRLIKKPDAAAASKLAKKMWRPLRPGQLAPRSKSFQGKGNSVRHRKGKILLCTYRALGLQYYKYTVGGVNIIFINLLPVIGFTILDFFVLEKYVEHRGITSGPLALITSQTFIFLLSLGSVIPLSYFIGMAVASISAQSSIGMGAVINATFGSIIEIILYALALTQHKARLVEGSIVGSILAGVLLMPGLSMVSGATRRKEQRFNARSAGVTSTMLIMAIIGILTPTLFYQIYGTFQLTCEGCPTDSVPGEVWTCKRCYYQHVPPSSDPFFQTNLKGLMYTCTVILVLSYGIGLWFSLRTHASQIWQNPQPVHAQAHQQIPGSAPHDSLSAAAHMASLPSAQRASIYKRLLPISAIQHVLPTTRTSTQTSHHQGQSSEQQNIGSVNSRSGVLDSRRSASEALPPLRLPENISQEEYARAVAITASAFHNAMQEHSRITSGQPGSARAAAHPNQAVPRSVAAERHLSKAEPDAAEDGEHGGHDAPSWSRATSVSVLLGCTVLYAIIAEILVDVVDVVLNGSGIDEKFLGITLFALVPNTTEFMNAMSFAINGNIALSMEIGSAYALQVCLIQIPAMVAFSAYYNHDKMGEIVDSIFTLIFPRWDVIAIIFSVFLLTYTYIEARSNYYRGSICILSYLVLIAGFFFAPASGDTENPPGDGLPSLISLSFQTLHGALGGPPVGSLSGVNTKTVGGLFSLATVPTMNGLAWVQAVLGSLWARICGQAQAAETDVAQRPPDVAPRISAQPKNDGPALDRRNGFRPPKNAKPHFVRPIGNAPISSGTTSLKAAAAAAAAQKGSTSFGVVKLPPSSNKFGQGHASDSIFKNQAFGWWRVTDDSVVGNAWPRARLERRRVMTEYMKGTPASAASRQLHK